MEQIDRNKFIGTLIYHYEMACSEIMSGLDDEWNQAQARLCVVLAREFGVDLHEAIAMVNWKTDRKAIQFTGYNIDEVLEFHKDYGNFSVEDGELFIVAYGENIKVEPSEWLILEPTSLVVFPLDNESYQRKIIAE